MAVERFDVLLQIAKFQSLFSFSRVFINPSSAPAHGEAAAQPPSRLPRRNLLGCAAPPPSPRAIWTPSSHSFFSPPLRLPVGRHKSTHTGGPRDGATYDEVSAGAVVFYRGDTVKYLLLYYPAGHWDWPKGNVEPGETPEQAALREVKEETGLEVELLPGFREEVEYVYSRGRRRIRKKVVFFLARAHSDDVRLSWEHEGYAWLTYDRALARITYDSSRRVLVKAHKYLKQLGLA